MSPAPPAEATARCHCGGIEMVAALPSRFCSLLLPELPHNHFESDRGNWADEMHLPLALFVTPVDRVPSVNSFPEERPDWAPLAHLPHD